jgi:ribonuclease J
LVIDLYTADVLDRISDGTNLPRAGFPNLKVVITKRLRSAYSSHGREEFVDRMAGFGISARSLIGTRDVVMLRRALIPDYVSALSEARLREVMTAARAFGARVR